jgi:hypothetical protein
VDVPEPMMLVVDGETFQARADPEQPGAWHLDWVNGPHDGYGFTTRRSDSRWAPREELEDQIRSFLQEIDPETGYLTE